jgi:hypothetical protein
MANLFTSLLAAFRVAKAKRIVADQRVLIARLRAAGQPTLDAESSLQIYLSALKLLEAPEQRIREENKTKKGERGQLQGFVRGATAEQGEAIRWQHHPDDRAILQFDGYPEPARRVRPHEPARNGNQVSSAGR